MNPFVLKLILEVLFVTLLFVHFSKKHSEFVVAFGIQSLAMAMLLFHSFLNTGNLFLLIIAVMALVVKVIIAPVFFVWLIRQQTSLLSVATYLNTPIRLIVISFLIFLAHTEGFFPLTQLIPHNQSFLSLSLSVIFLSVFLIINRKGALSQIIGVLSLENSIVAFSLFAGLEQSPVLQIGVMFNICIWVVIATMFAARILRHFGSLNVTIMTHLKD